MILCWRASDKKFRVTSTYMLFKAVRVVSRLEKCAINFCAVGQLWYSMALLEKILYQSSPYTQLNG